MAETELNLRLNTEMRKATLANDEQLFDVLRDCQNATAWNTRASSGVSVKGLEWYKADGDWWGNSDVGVGYHIAGRGARWVLSFPSPLPRSERFDSLDLAKAAAQADYEARIRSALSPAVSVPEGVLVPVWVLKAVTEIAARNEQSPAIVEARSLLSVAPPSPEGAQPGSSLSQAGEDE